MLKITKGYFIAKKIVYPECLKGFIIYIIIINHTFHNRASISKIKRKQIISIVNIKIIYDPNKWHIPKPLSEEK